MQILIILSSLLYDFNFKEPEVIDYSYLTDQVTVGIDHFETEVDEYQKYYETHYFNGEYIDLLKMSLTPIPEYKTPVQGYDRSKAPGILMLNFNFNDLSIHDPIIKVEEKIGEFIFTEKELLKFQEEYKI